MSKAKHMNEPEQPVQLEPMRYGKIMIEIDIDTDKYNIGFSDMETAKTLKQIEQVNLFSPFHAACIINEIKRRRNASPIKPVHLIITDGIKR